MMAFYTLMVCENVSLVMVYHHLSLHSPWVRIVALVLVYGCTFIGKH